MRQRVMIAIALSLRPELLIADEPTTALDVTIQAQILDLMKDLTRGSASAVIFITHNFGVVARYADRVAVMYAARQIESGVSRRTSSHAPPSLHRGTAATPCRVSTSHAAIGSRPSRACRPISLAPPAGCRFAPRCAWRVASVRARPAADAIVGDGQWRRAGAQRI